MMTAAKKKIVARRDQKRRVVRIKKKVADRYSPDRDEKIRACRGVYSAVETAEYFALTRKRVYQTWNLPSKKEDVEPPNIVTEKRSTEVLYEDGVILLNRGVSLGEAARQLHTTRDKLAGILRKRPSGMEALERDRDASEAWKRGRNNPRGSYGYAGIDYPNNY